MDLGNILLCFSFMVVGSVQGQESSMLMTTSSVPLAQDDQCPPWFFYNKATKACECYSSPSTDEIVKCTERGALLRYGHCMTYEEGEGTFIGRCQYFEISGHNVTEPPGFITLPDNISELNDYMCGPMNRKGLVCSECIAGFGPSVTSFGFPCSNCTNAWYGVPLYLFLEFVPVTVFYLIVLIFRISFTSAPWTGFVLYSQFAVAGVTTVFGPSSFETSPIIYLFSAIISFYGIWNLDFFRYIIPPFCVFPSLRIIHIVFLGYVSAFYPLCLIGLTWICIELHSRNFKLFVWSWNKLNGCFIKHVKRDSKSTMVDVFSTFFLLSYTKLVIIFVATIEPEFIPNMNNHPPRRVLNVDPSIEWFGTQNFPFVIISLFLFLVLIVPPVVLLTFYPTKVFRSLLSKLSLSGHSRAALNIFVEKFYSSYRDSLDGGRDMRGLASLYFILRIVVYLLSIVERYFVYNALLLGGIGFFIAIVRPYKKTYMNIIDSLIMANLAYCLVMFDLYFRESVGSTAALFYALNIGIISSLPIWGSLGFVMYKTIPFRKLFELMNLRLSKVFCCNKKKDNEEDAAQQGNVDKCDGDHPELPDRMLNPELYDREIT